MALPDPIIHELAGLRGLARALVHGDADADDLLQDVAIATLAHPPATDQPVRPWLATVLRNRWRMDRRAARRREARDTAAAIEPAGAVDDRDPIDRARMLERLGAALVALDEPFRATVIRRYLDGETAATIARALGVPAGTVRWRLKTGLDRLRAALDAHASRDRWQLALMPAPLIAGSHHTAAALGGLLVKIKTKLMLVALLAALLAGGVLLVGRRGPAEAPPATATSLPEHRAIVSDAQPSPLTAVAEPRPGQGRPIVAAAPAPGGLVRGRVINWSTGNGVDGADLTFIGEAGATTVHSVAGGAFELAPAAPGRFTLAAAAAPGFLPYAPELAHSTVHLQLSRDREVGGVIVFLFPALDYHGRVVDAAGTPVAHATVRLLGSPMGEQAIDSLQSSWISDARGEFTFHAPDDATLEAISGARHGLARLDGNVAITKQLVIALGTGETRDATITGRVTDAQGAPLADALVRANPPEHGRSKTIARATAFATSGVDGTFVLAGVDRGDYFVTAELDGFAASPGVTVAGDAREVVIALDAGATIAGTVTTADHAAVPAYTVVAYRRAGAGRELVIERSIVDALGRFELRVTPGSYELIASASGWAPSAPTAATAGSKDVALVVSPGATLRGVVTSSAGGGVVAYARVMREARGGGASASPANAGTVTRDDGTFELAGIPAGPLSITIGADSFHPRIEAGMTAHDGETLGPVTLALTPLAAGEEPALELVGIGVALAADGDALRVERVIPDSGAAAAGIVVGDHVVTVDGAAVTELGVEGAVAKIRGVAGTTIAIALRRGDQVITLEVQRRKLRA